MNIEVNFIVILLASVVSMALGYFWYSQTLLGKPWMRLMGYTKEDLTEAKRGMAKLYGVSFILTLVSAYVLFHVMTLAKSFYGYSSTATGLTSGFWMWLGFIAPVQTADTLFSNQNTRQLAAGMNGSQKNSPQDTPSAKLTSSSFGSKNWQLLAINTGYQLISLLLMGLTIGLLS